MTDATRYAIRQFAQQLLTGERVPTDEGPQLGTVVLRLLEEYEALERRIAAHEGLLQELQARYSEGWASTIDRLLARDRRQN